MSHDSVRNIWECDDCGQRYQAQAHLETHQSSCSQYLGTQAERARPLPPAPDPVPDEDDQPETPAKKNKRK